MGQIDWKHLRSERDLDEALARADDGTVVIFKHSTRCAVSSMALRMFERDWQPRKEAPTTYFLDLIANRNLSDRIAHALGVDHESPQVIVVKNGTVIYHASHSLISARDVLEAGGA